MDINSHKSETPADTATAENAIEEHGASKTTESTSAKAATTENTKDAGISRNDDITDNTIINESSAITGNADIVSNPNITEDADRVKSDIAEGSAETDTTKKRPNFTTDKKLPAIPPTLPQPLPSEYLSTDNSFGKRCWKYIRPLLHELNKVPVFLVNGTLTAITLGGVPHKWPLKDRSNWLQELANSNSQLRLYETAIPGTHNSATYCYESIGKPYSVCQNSTLLEQLNGGIRFLDLRVCDDAGFDDHLWVSHTLLCQPLEPQLIQIREFLDKKPNEIVLVQIKRDFNRLLSPHGAEKLDNLIRSLFAGRLISQREIESLSVANLINTGKQLVLLNDDLGLPSNLDSPHVRSSWTATHDHDPRRLVAQLRGWARDTAPALPPIISNLEVIITPTVRSVILSVYKSIYSWSKELKKAVLEPGGLLDDLKAIPNPRRLNVVTFDFASDDMIEAIIALNYSKPLDEEELVVSSLRLANHTAIGSTSSAGFASVKKGTRQCWPRFRGRKFS